MKRTALQVSVAVAVAIVGCDLGEPVVQGTPVLEDVESMETLDFDSICADIEACCGIDTVHCAQELSTLADGVAWDVQFLADHGVQLQRDDACPVLPHASALALQCNVDEACVAPCNPWVGTVEAGSQCRRFGHASDCAQGLQCFGAIEAQDGMDIGVCADPCATTGIACRNSGSFVSNGWLLEGSRQCGPVGYCDADIDAWATCTPVLQAGDPCPQGRGCAIGLYCDSAGPSQVCAPRKSPGSTCDPSLGADQCVDGYLCEQGMCVQEWSAAPQGAPLGCASAASL
jgi:hypothetical protein